MTNKPILCVDFDGVIHSYSSGWKEVDIIPDPPVVGAISWLLMAIEWWDVHIYSSRSKSAAGLMAMFEWTYNNAYRELPEADAKILMKNIKFSHEKPAAFLTIDDRAVCFDGDWSKLDPETLRQFKPWNRK